MAAEERELTAKEAYELRKRKSVIEKQESTPQAASPYLPSPTATRDMVEEKLIKQQLNHGTIRTLILVFILLSVAVSFFVKAGLVDDDAGESYGEYSSTSVKRTFAIEEPVIDQTAPVNAKFLSDMDNYGISLDGIEIRVGDSAGSFLDDVAWNEYTVKYLEIPVPPGETELLHLKSTSDMYFVVINPTNKNAAISECKVASIAMSPRGLFVRENVRLFGDLSIEYNLHDFVEYLGPPGSWKYYGPDEDSDSSFWIAIWSPEEYGPYYFDAPMHIRVVGDGAVVKDIEFTLKT